MDQRKPGLSALAIVITGIDQFFLTQLPAVRARSRCVGDPGCHRWRFTQAAMNTAEVIGRKPKRNSGPVVLPLLAEGVR